MNKQHDQGKVLGERVKCMHALSQKQQKDNKAGCVQLKKAVPVFADLLHKQLFNKLIEKDHTDAEDIERMVLFYLLSGDRELYEKHRYIYDFNEHCIINCIQGRTADFASSTKALIRLGFNLYNGYIDDYISPSQLFYNLDERNRILALKAIEIRYVSGHRDTLLNLS